MKKITFFVRLLVFTIFFVNTGIISEMSSRIASDKKVNLMNMPIANRLSIEIADRAREQVRKGITYSPDDYFRDINKISRLEDSLSVFGVLPSVTSELQMMLISSIDKGLYTHADIDRARKNLADKNEYFREEFFKEVRHTPIMEIICPTFLWFLKQYVLGLIPAFLLILLWAYEKERFKNPFSILLSLISYPIFFSIVFFQWTREKGREMYAETQLRRTKDVFLSILSENEVSAIKAFAQSNLSLDTWNADLSGSFRRSFALAFIAFILCSISTTRAASEIEHHAVTSYETVVDSGGLHSIDYDVGITASVSDNGFKIRFSFPTIISFDRAPILLRGFFNRIEHIPLSGLLYSFFNLNNSIINNKEKGNESCLCNNRNYVFICL